VADTGSFSLAADQLFLTQPAVSKRIAALEEELAARLFERLGKGVLLTEAGRTLLPKARHILAEMADGRRLIANLATGVSGVLELATSHHIGLHRLPPVLSEFSRAFPAVHIDIDFMDSEQAYELTQRGEVELAVVTLAPAPVTKIIARTIWSDPLDFMVQSGHELAQRTGMDLKELSSHPAILPGLNTYTGQIVKLLFERRGLPIQIAIATNYLETIRMMASVGLGWTVLPRSMLDASLATLPIRDARIERSLGVVHHEGRSLSRAARAFVDALMDAAAKGAS